MVVRGRRRSNSELAALHDTKRTLNSRGGGISSVSSVSDVSSVAGSVASKVKYLCHRLREICTRRTQPHANHPSLDNALEKVGQGRRSRYGRHPSERVRAPRGDDGSGGGEVLRGERQEQLHPRHWIHRSCALLPEIDFKSNNKCME